MVGDSSFWAELAADAQSIRERLEHRASRSQNPHERKRVERLASYVLILTELMHPSGGGRG